MYKMVKATQKAKIAARKAIEKTYNGIAIISEYQKVKDEKTGLTNSQPVIVLENQPCKLSFERLQEAMQGQSASAVKQIVKLFIAPEITIKAGSKITVTQSGITTDYTYSGIPAVYDTHQEIILSLFEKWG